MPEFDLTSKVAEHLDRHMIFPLLEFLSSRKIYDDKSILTMKLELLNKTNMVDFAVDCYKNLNQEDEIPERKWTLILALTCRYNVTVLTRFHYHC